jgi:hypothetical protein
VAVTFEFWGWFRAGNSKRCALWGWKGQKKGVSFSQVSGPWADSRRVLVYLGYFGTWPISISFSLFKSSTQQNCTIAGSPQSKGKYILQKKFEQDNLETGEMVELEKLHWTVYNIYKCKSNLEFYVHRHFIITRC